MAAGTSPSFFWTLLSACLLGFTCADHKTITAESGQNVTLPCRAPNNIIVIKWSRADLRTEYVLLYRDEQLDPEHQHPSFKNRVDLQDRQMKDGDVSLILKDVMINDAGIYGCRVVLGLREPMRFISIIYLRVDPPGPGNSEDGGKKVGVSRGRYGPAASGLLLLAVVVVAAAVISNKQKKDPPPHLPPDEEAKKELV